MITQLKNKRRKKSESSAKKWVKVNFQRFSLAFNIVLFIYLFYWTFSVFASVSNVRNVKNLANPNNTTSLSSYVGYLV